MQLTYRGQTYTYSPVPVCPTTLCNVETRYLIYRGQDVTLALSATPRKRLPAAINWRFSIPAATEMGRLRPAH